MTAGQISRATITGFLMCGVALPAGAQVPGQILAPPANHWLQFGYAVDASADTVAVGAPDSIRNNDASNCSVAASGFGAVAIYTKSGNGWVLSQQLWHDPFSPTDTIDWEPRFGSSVSLRGNTLAVSAPRLPVNGQFGVGGFYVFQRTSPSAQFSRVGPILAPSPTGNARLGDISGIATNGTYVAVADDSSKSVLFYEIQGSTVSYVASTPSLAGIPERLFITDNNVLIAFISGYPTLLAYQLGPSSLFQIDTSSLNDGTFYTRPAGGDGNTFVSGVNNDATAYRAVAFGTSGVSSVKAFTVPIPYDLPNPPTSSSPFPAALAVREGSGAYVSLTDSTIADGYVAGILAGSFVSVSTIRPATMAGVVTSTSWGQPIAFNGSELFVSDLASNPGGACSTDFPSVGQVRQLLAGGLGIAIETVSPLLP